MRAISVFLLFVAVASALPTNDKSSRIIGGQVTTIDRYPYAVVMLRNRGSGAFIHDCGGSILNQRSILSAAHCFFFNRNPALWRARAGSSFAHSGGSVHNAVEIIMHPQYVPMVAYIDIAIVRVQVNFQYSPTIQPGPIAGPNYNAGDNQVVWAVGWGTTELGSVSEQLRDVQIYTINQQICADRYGPRINWSMLCAGVLNVGGRDQCGGDSGGPLLHKGIVIGVTSFGNGCADPFYPGVNARVSYVSPWISNNA